MQPLARILLALSALFPLACTGADAPKYELGKDYKAVRVPQAPADPSKIEVLEVFAYSCPHCFNLEPRVEKWLESKPADVSFERLPVTFGQAANEVRNKGYYASQMLGVTARFHRALFAAIHGQNRPMSTEQDIRRLFVEHTGVKGEDFDGAYRGFATDSRYRIGENKIRELGVTSVPQIAVDGKYLVPNGQRVFEIVDYLVEQARRERKGAKAR